MKHALITPLLAACLAVPLAHADTPTDDDPSNLSGSAELGFVATSGNSDTNNINGRLNLTQESVQWRTDYSLSALSSSSDSETTAEKYSGTVQSNYKFDTEQFWFVRGAHEEDRFSGYRHKSSASTGYGNRFWQKGDGSYLEASAGVGYREFAIDRDIDADGKSDRGTFVRLAATYEYHFTASSLFHQELNTEASVDGGNDVYESVSAIQANIVDNLAMKLAYRVKYTSDVPANTDTTDTETTASVLYSF
ncbi:DUF481 domain-containing protein [Marinomonas ostreistagni]|uniref:DUF481 domain-containing protein n=1 Tax=Marinomonas ostreistagni TaxID=359209 RepID=UPI00194E88E0|nr:DUF481 domain-containing protein [Marinomonas ostreistagni]MBM6550845.1 DUF481 domain-containing protein [Marinomonas ostreistagni]